MTKLFVVFASIIALSAFAPTTAHALSALQIARAVALCQAYAPDPERCIEIAKSEQVPDSIKISCYHAWKRKDEEGKQICASRLAAY